jgi:hypothetical protein
MSILNENILVDVKYINQKLPRKNIMGRRWRMINNLVIGVTDLRARVGEFSTPWMAPTNPLYAMPDFQYCPDSLSDLFDRRALELLEESRRTNKTILVFWSGGIDSTAVLSSFLKNWKPQDLERIAVVMSSNSILENFEFYHKFISGKIRCLHYPLLDMTNELLESNIVVHGDPGDCLFGPSMPAYRALVENGQHLEPYRRHLDRIIDSLQPPESSPHYVEGFGKWIVEKFTDNLEQVAPPGVDTVVGWWWWTYYNFKWQFSCQRPFFFNRSDFKAPISDKNLQDYARNVYFGTDYFQNWSHSNLHRLIGNSTSTHKLDARTYIRELDHNEFYFSKKTKTAGAPANSELRTSAYLPLCYDKNWVGHYYWEDHLDANAHIALETYKG